MINSNLIGYEDHYYCYYQRPKNLLNHQKKIIKIKERKNKYCIDKEDYSINKFLENNTSSHKRSLSYIDSCNNKVFFPKNKINQINK